MNAKKSHTIAITVGLLLLIELVTCWQYRGPAVVSAGDDGEADTTLKPIRFSAAQALQHHRHLFPDAPHPPGSAENRAVRDRLVKLLQDHGWAIEVRTHEVTLGEDPSAETISLSNVIAHRSELDKLSSTPLLLTTHYDSCRFGPGAGDAGGCVAALVEAGRLLTRDVSVLKRPVWLVFTDGEEAGLLGAKEFVRSHPVSQRRPYVLNFDARGTTGPVVMYETHPGNNHAVQQWINDLARPRVTGSLFTAVYRTLPNRTDFSVFQQAGWQGFNFAIIDGAHRYHRPDDTLANLDPRSVQHFGEQALSVGTKIATMDVDLPAGHGNAVYFDVLGLYVIRYPVAWCLYIRFALLITAVQLYGRSALRKGSRRDSIAVWLTMVFILMTNIVLGWVFSQSIRETILLPRPFVWYGHVLSLLMWCLSLLASCSVARGMLARVQHESIWNAFWLGQAVTNLVVSWFAPEFSHLLVIPAIFAVVLTFAVRPILLRTLLVMIAAGVILIPVQHLLAIVLGPNGGVILFPAFALIAMPMLPLFGRSYEAQHNSHFSGIR